MTPIDNDHHICPRCNHVHEYAHKIDPKAKRFGLSNCLNPKCICVKGWSYRNNKYEYFDDPTYETLQTEKELRE